MEDTKPWYTSKTIWAAFLIVIISLLKMAGLGEHAQTIEGESEKIVEWVMQIIPLALAATAFIGRLFATKKLL